MPSKPVLHYALRSPPSRSVLLTAAAIGLELDLQESDFNSPGFEKLNPVRTVPVLNDNGTIVNDSHVINAYLVDKYASDDKLYPKDPQKRRDVDTLLFFDACHLFPRARFAVDPIFYRGATKVEEKDIEYMQQSYDLLEKRIGDSPYLCGDQITIADFHAVTSVTSGMIPAPLIDEKHPKIKAWINRLSQLPYYEKINQAGLNILGGFVKHVLEANNKAKGQ